VWLFAALGIYALSFLAAGLALQGATSRPIAWRRTSLVQLAVAFTNQLAPSGLGGLATNIRYLEGQGASRPAAVTAVGLNTVAGFLVHVAFVAAIVPIVGIAGGLRAPRPPHLPHYWVIPFAVLVVLVAAGVWFWRHRLHRLLAMARESWDAIVDVGRRPRRALALFGGSAGVTAAQALALVLSLHAFGNTLPVLDVVAVFLVGSVVAAAAPTPGGLGALEAALVAGLTQLGAPVGASVAGVLASRLITFWLPIVPGAFAFHALRRRAVL
jgi:undecaprenyl-diphosphatase